jgi:hypothetical protein
MPVAKLFVIVSLGRQYSTDRPCRSLRPLLFMTVRPPTERPDAVHGATDA